MCFGCAITARVKLNNILLCIINGGLQASGHVDVPNHLSHVADKYSLQPYVVKVCPLKVSTTTQLTPNLRVAKVLSRTLCFVVCFRWFTKGDGGPWSLSTSGKKRTQGCIQRIKAYGIRVYFCIATCHRRAVGWQWQALPCPTNFLSPSPVPVGLTVRNPHEARPRGVFIGSQVSTFLGFFCIIFIGWPLSDSHL